MTRVDFFAFGLPSCGLVDNDQAAGVSQFDLCRFDGIDPNLSFFDASVSFVYRLVKKGVGVLSSLWAVFIGERRGSLLCSR